MKTLTTPDLERLDLTLNVALYQPSDWAALNAFLSPARFPCLRSLTVALFPKKHNTDNEFLRKALTSLEAGALWAGHHD
jgi:hypothetical protein